MNKVTVEPINIGLIGPGEIGAVIVRKLRDAGYPVKMANSKGPDSLKKLAAETGAKPVSVEEVVQDVDVLWPSAVDAGQTQIHRGLLARFIHRHEQAIGFGLVLGLEAGEGFGGVVEGVVNAFATEK